MINITYTTDFLLIEVEGKEYPYPVDSVYLDMSRDNRILVRENSDQLLIAGELLWDFPAQYTVIHHICQ